MVGMWLTLVQSLHSADLLSVQVIILLFLAKSLFLNKHGSLVQESHHSGTQGIPCGHQTQTLFTGTGEKTGHPKEQSQGWVWAWLLLPL